MSSDLENRKAIEEAILTIAMVVVMIAFFLFVFGMISESLRGWFFVVAFALAFVAFSLSVIHQKMVKARRRFYKPVVKQDWKQN